MHIGASVHTPDKCEHTCAGCMCACSSAQQATHMRLAAATHGGLNPQFMHATTTSTTPTISSSMPAYTSPC